MGQDMYSKYAETPKALSTPSGAGAAGVRYVLSLYGGKARGKCSRCGSLPACGVAFSPDHVRRAFETRSIVEAMRRCSPRSGAAQSTLSGLKDGCVACCGMLCTHRPLRSRLFQVYDAAAQQLPRARGIVDAA